PETVVAVMMADGRPKRSRTRLPSGSGKSTITRVYCIPGRWSGNRGGTTVREGQENHRGASGRPMAAGMRGTQHGGRGEYRERESDTRHALRGVHRVSPRGRRWAGH